MYIKIFESRTSIRSYLIQYKISGLSSDNDKFFLVNEDSNKLEIDEHELFNLIDWYYKEKLNEKRTKTS